MSPVLAVYGKEDILEYVHGTLESDEEKQDIESLVESDPRAAMVVSKLKSGNLDDREVFDDTARERLDKLQNIARCAGIVT